ncbi:dienelactone hydrolase family protein, partial [Nocardia wallacei]|uniref:dienelactone hydrolase family protein n=1 Tax=Nocardia wallacei TaxID=480035 RepID=UPI002455856E
MTAVQGLSVDVPTPGGVADSYLAAPADGAPHPGVLLYMDAFGLRPSLRAMADRIAAHGYTALVPNVFYRHGRAPVVELPDFIDPGQRPDIFQRLLPMIQELTPEIAAADAAAYLEWLAAHDRTAAGPVGLTGYCMGARLVVYTAAAFPDRVAAAPGVPRGGRGTPPPPHPPPPPAHPPPNLYLPGPPPLLHPNRHRRLQRTGRRTPLARTIGPT